MSVVYDTFLRNFCGRDGDTVRSEDERFCDQLRSKLAHEEVEGECLDLCLQYLSSCEKCPEQLAAFVAREVAEKILNDSLGKADCKSSGCKATGKDGEKNADGDTDETDFDGIDGVWLAKEVISATKEVCSRWKTQPPSSLLEPSQKNCHYVSDYAIKNTRRKMEDRHVILPYFCQLSGLKMPGNLRFYGVYDGHGGTEAARYAAVHLHCHLSKGLKSGLEISKAISEAFSTTDKLFVDLAKRENISSGSTAICAVLDDQMFHVAWLGDSQAVLVRSGKPVTLMDPHKPEREDERKRIEGLGGYVVWFGAWRVNGNLSVSRAIGDANFKPYISAEPDVASFPRQPSDDDYLVLACDGLWDVLKHEDLIQEIQIYLDGGNDRSTVAKRLTEVAKDRGSSDNITVIVIFLRDGSASKSCGKDNKKFDVKVADDASHLTGHRGSPQSDSSTRSRGSEAQNASPDKVRGSVNEHTENSRLTLGMECTTCVDAIAAFREELTEDDSNEVESSDDVHVLSGDSAKNVLNPLRIHSSDDTNGPNISGETDFEPICYDLSPPSDQPRDRRSNDSGNSLSPDSSRLEGQSDTSVSNVGARSNVGAFDVTSKRSRRRRSGNRRSRKENLRPSHEKLKTGTPPCVQSISADRKQLEISIRESSRSLSQASSHLLKMLSGFGARSPPQRPSSSSRSTNKDRWTIAVEVEDWATMFESNKPIGTTQTMNLSTHW